MRALGKTNLEVSVLGFGTLELGRVAQEQVQPLLYRVLDTGINVLDTAACYGNSEALIGQALGTRRQQCYLFTKCGHASGQLDLPDWQPRLLEQSIERSLQRLKTDYLDLLFLHSCSEQVLQRGEVIEVLQRARQAGKTRYIGYSGDRQAAHYAVQCGAFDALGISLNIADQEAITRVLPLAASKQMGIIAKRSLANVVWKREQAPEEDYLRIYWDRLKALNYPFLKQPLAEAVAFAQRFTLSIPEVNMMLIGTTNPDRISENVNTLQAGALAQEQYRAIRRRWQALTWWRHPLPGGRQGWHGIV